MKKPHLMRMDELVSLPTFTADGVFDRATSFGGCFRDRSGLLWGTCLIDGVWARFPAAQLAKRTSVAEPALSEPSTLRGYIDFYDGAYVRGWAQDEADPDGEVEIAISVNGKLAARALAASFRHDLEAAGIGNGHHAFDVALPSVNTRDAAIVVVQRVDDGIVLDIAVVPQRPAR